MYNIMYIVFISQGYFKQCHFVYITNYRNTATKLDKRISLHVFKITYCLIQNSFVHIYTMKELLITIYSCNVTDVDQIHCCHSVEKSFIKRTVFPNHALFL